MSIVDSHEVKWSATNKRLEAYVGGEWVSVDELRAAAADAHVEALERELHAFRLAYKAMMGQTPRTPGTPTSVDMISYHSGFTKATQVFRVSMLNSGFPMVGDP